MKTIGLFLFLLLAQTCLAQLQASKLEQRSIPKTIQYSGRIVHAVGWSDSLGNHIVIATETGETKSKGPENEDNRDAALYAYHFIRQGEEWKQTWKVYDFIKACPVDIKANFIRNTFSVTDLNRDGVGEVWLMYETVCHGDVSPGDMKIIMYEGNKKHAVRGRNKVQVSEKEYEGGEFAFDEAFKRAPDSFRKYAVQLWKKNIMETWE